MFGQGTPEIPSGIIENNTNNVKPEKDQFTEINLVGIFDEDSVINLENEFQDFFSALAGNQIEWRGFMLSFYKPEAINRFEVGFKAKCRFEEIGDKRAQMLEYIHELGGIMGEIQTLDAGLA